jgi:hypothetical protein
VASVKKTMRREGEESHLDGRARVELREEGKAGSRGEKKKWEVNAVEERERVMIWEHKLR